LQKETSQARNISNGADDIGALLVRPVARQLCVVACHFEAIAMVGTHHFHGPLHPRRLVIPNQSAISWTPLHHNPDSRTRAMDSDRSHNHLEAVASMHLDPFRAWLHHRPRRILTCIIGLSRSRLQVTRASLSAVRSSIGVLATIDWLPTAERGRTGLQLLRRDDGQSASKRREPRGGRRRHVGRRSQLGVGA